MDLLSYINSNAKASSAKYQSVKTRLKTILAEREPDMDLSDNSVVGDLILNRFANIVALAEEAQACILSDIQLNNILNGNVCDCAFTEAFIKSLGLDALASVNTTGVLRIKFKAEAIDAYFNGLPVNTNAFDTRTFYIDKGTSIAFGDYMFRFFAPADGPIKIRFLNENDSIFASDYASKSLTQSSAALDNINNGAEKISENYYHAVIDAEENIIVDNGTVAPQAYIVDLPIYGPTDASVLENSTPLTSLPTAVLENFILDNGIYTVKAINPYETPTSLIDLTKLAIKLYPSSNFANKSGVVSYLTKMFPSINCVTPVTSNDKAGRLETINVGNTTVGLKKFTLDIYTKTGTPDDLITVTQVIPAAQFDTFAFMAPPVEIKELTWTALNGGNAPALAEEIIVDTINPADSLDISTYANFSLLYGTPICDLDFLDFLTSKYAKFANCSLSISNSKISKDAGYDGYITITYTYDPAMLFVGSLINSPSCAPFFSTEVKNYIKYKLNLVANYKKQISTYFDRQEAEEDIYQLLNKLHYPIVYNDAYIADILITNGAYSIDYIGTSGTIEICPFSTYAQVVYNNNQLGLTCGVVPTLALNKINSFNYITATRVEDSNNNVLNTRYYTNQNIAPFITRDLISLSENIASTVEN